MKTIRRKDKTEFASLNEFGELCTHEHPEPFGEGVTIDELKKYCTEEDVNWDDYEVVELEYSEKGVIGADIRNKLGPLLTLVNLLEKQKEVDDEMKKKLQKYIDDSIAQSKISIEYLKNLL